MTEELQKLNLQITRLAEFAEATLPQINEQLNRLHDLGLISTCLIRADTVWQRPYNEAFTVASSGQVLQAVLIIPGGFGLLVLDTEDFVQMHNQEVARDELKHWVEPVTKCRPAEQAYIYLQCGSLFRDLIRQQGLLRPKDQA